MRIPITALLIPALSAALGGCQRYSRSPLDLDAHRAAVALRSPIRPDVVEFARRSGAAPAGSGRYDPSDGLSLPEAEAVALFFNPQLRLARQRANVPRAGAAEAGRWEDPELAVDAERIIESVRDPWVLGGMLNITLPLSGRTGSERRKAMAEATVGGLRAIAEEWRVLAELRQEWVGWSAAGQRVEVTRQLVQELDAFARRADQLREAGELGPLDARLFHLQRVRHAAKLRGYESADRIARLRLRALIGLAPAADVAFVPSMEGDPPPAPDDLAQAVQNHPRLRIARAEYEVAERTLALEVRKQYPDLKLGGGFGTDEGDERVLFGAAVPLPLLNANRRAIAEARANRDAVKAAAESEFEQLIGEAAAARATLEGARERLRYVEQELAPLADRQVEDAVRLGRAGEFEALVLLEALTAAYEAKLEVVDARSGVALAQRQLDALLPAPPAGKDLP